MRSITFHMQTDPVAFARAGSQGSRRFTPQKQAAYMAMVRDHGKRAMEGNPPLEGPLEMWVRFTFVAPKSWSVKKRIENLWKVSRSDLDNLVKIVADSLGRHVIKDARGRPAIHDDCVYIDDAQIAILIAQKRYGPKAEIVVTVMELELELEEMT